MSTDTPRSPLTRVGRAALRRVAHHLSTSAQVKRLVRLVLDRMPALQAPVYAWIYGPGPRSPHRLHLPSGSDDLSPRTETAYRELKQHFDARKR